MKVGDLVRVIGVPERLPDSPETLEVFRRCVGRTFPIIDIAAGGLLELEVGEVMGVHPVMHSVWIEPGSSFWLSDLAFYLPLPQDWGRVGRGSMQP